MHPYCRCTTVPYDKDLPDVETRWSRDPETGKGVYVKDMNYSEWNKSVNQKRYQKRLGYQDWKKVSGIIIIGLNMLKSLSSPKKDNQQVPKTLE